MRTTLIALLFAGSLSVFALGNADVAVTSITANKTSAQTGEDVTLTIGVKNNGPAEAIDVNLNLGNSYGGRLDLLSSTATAGWQCSPVYTNCWSLNVPADGEAMLTLTVLTPPTVRPDPFRVFAVVSSGNESNIDNNWSDYLEIPLHAASRAADLSITVSAPPNPIARNAPLTLSYDVRNNGPEDLNDIRVDVGVTTVFQPATITGAGWTCETHTPILTSCRRSSLGAGASAPLEVRLTTPSFDIEMSVFARVFAAQAHVEANPANNEVWRTIFVGSASNWRRILLPITATDIPGANGSLWKTDIRAAIETLEGVAIEPAGCGAIEDPCSYPPVNQMFDVRDEDLIISDFGAQFLYVGSEGASKLKVSTRVYDASKAEETAGAFIPTARDEDFSVEGFSLIGIPVAPQFRSTLRIYDYDGTGGEVAFALYSDDASEPFHRGVASLRGDDDWKLTTALLPAHPAIAQLDLSSFIPAGQYSRVRVIVQPQESMKVWGFVSITNNQTSHVTIVSP